MKEPTIEELRAFAKEDPAFVAELREKMATDGKMQEAGLVAAVQRVLVKAGLCTVEDIDRFVAESKPLIIEVSLAYFESDEAVAKASAKYVHWLKTGETS